MKSKYKSPPDAQEIASAIQTSPITPKSATNVASAANTTSNTDELGPSFVKRPVDRGPQREIQQRQQFIDQLILELDKKSNALEIVGAECVSLRTEIKSLLETVAMLKQKVDESEVDTKKLLNCYDLTILSPEELRFKYTKLANKLDDCLAWIKKVEPLTKAHNTLLENHHELQVEHAQLQDAHSQQQEILLDLQGLVGTAEKYKAVILKQEMVIQQLELRLQDSNLHPKPGRSEGIPGTTSNPGVAIKESKKSSGKSKLESENSHHEDYKSRAESAEAKVRELERIVLGPKY